MITVPNNWIKTVIILAGFVVITLVYYGYKIRFVNNALFTEGIVTTHYKHGINKSDFGQTYSAEIKFYAQDSLITFLGPEGQLMKRGEIIPIMYNPNNPSEAYINTFDGYWYNGMIWCLLPAIFWLAISASLLKTSD